MEQDILRVTIVDKDDSGINVKCGIETDYFQVVAQAIVLEMERHPEFKKAIISAMMLYGGNKDGRTDN